jgi:glycosyltransferase involved in cell wall biosynthesis
MTVAHPRRLRPPHSRTDGFIAMVSEHASPLATLGGEDAGGQNIHVAMLAGALADRGHEVVVYTRRDDVSLPERVRLRRGVVVEHLDAGPPQAIAKDELRPYVPEMAADLRRRWLRRIPAVVHTHFWMSGLAALPAATELGVPVLHTFHALGTVKRRLQGEHDGSPADRIASERLLAGTVDRVIATCSDEVTELQAMGLLDGRVDVVPCGVDVKQFQPRGQRAARTDRHRLISVGRLVRRKGVDDVIDALAELPDTELLVAGGPPAAELNTDDEARRLRHRAQARGVSDRVQLLGGVDRAGVAELMRSADLAVCAPWYEPFGIVPLEAMACGVPVVATAVGGLLDTVSDGVTGRHVPPRRPDLLARAIAELLADPQRRQAMGAAGVRRVARRYTWEQVARLTERSYARVVEQAFGSRGAATSAAAVSELSA